MEGPQVEEPDGREPAVVGPAAEEPAVLGPAGSRGTAKRVEPAGGPASPWGDTVLDRIVAQALDPAYAAARAGARVPGPNRARRGGRLLVPAALLLAGLLVSVTALRAVQEAPARERLRAALGAEYAARSIDRDQLAGRVGALRSVTEALRARERAADELRQTLTARIDGLAPSAGLTAARGPGVRVTLADPPAGLSAAAGNPRPPQQGPDGRLADHDLADVVNTLWSAGAEAIAVNGVRLTALSAVRGAGDTILVGLVPVAAPYVVEAIGDPDAMAGRFETSPVAIRLRTRSGAPPDAVTVAAVPELTAPAAPGPTLRHAQGSGS